MTNEILSKLTAETFVCQFLVNFVSNAEDFVACSNTRENNTTAIGKLARVDQYQNLSKTETQTVTPTFVVFYLDFRCISYNIIFNNNCYSLRKLARKLPKLIPESSLNLQAETLFLLLFRNLIRTVRRVLVVTSLAEISIGMLKLPTETYGYPWS